MYAVLGGAALGLVDRRLVALLQPGALARARGRAGPDAGGGARDEALRPPVGREGRDGDAAVPLLGPGPEPRSRRLGGGQPSPRAGAEARLDGGRHPARVRSVHDRALRRSQRRRPPGPPLALDADARGPACWPRAATSPLRAPSRSAGRRRRDARAAPPPVAAEPSGAGAPRLGRREAPEARRTGRRRARRRVPVAPAAAATRPPCGPASAAPVATVSSAACGSRPTGPSRRPVELWRRRSGPAGRPSRSAATSSTPRSSVATTSRSSCYRLATGRAGVDARRRRSVLRSRTAGLGPRAHADPRQRPRLHASARPDPERARRRERCRRVVARRGGGHEASRSRTGASPARRSWWATP